MKKIYFIILSALFSLQVNSQCASTCSFVSTATAVGTSSSVTIAKPSGIVPGDVMIAAIHVGWCNSGSTITGPAGWTSIGQTSNTGTGCGSTNTTRQLATFYKVVTNSEPLNYTFSGTSNQYYVGGIAAYTGVYSPSPIHMASSKGNQDDCTNIVTNNITTTVTCTRLISVFFCSVNSSKTNIIPQASLTERFDIGTTGNHPWGNENVELSDEPMLSAGATGVKSASLSTCSGTGWVTGAQIIALNCALTTSIQDKSLQGLSTIIPNPSAGIFEISLSEDILNNATYEIHDCVGKLVKRSEIKEKKTMVDLSTEAKGIYFLKISSAKGTILQKIIVE